MGLLADIQAVSANSKKLAMDTAALATAQAAVAADTTGAGVADQKLSADLQASGPTFDPTPNADGSLNCYLFASTPPGYTITVFKPAT